MMDEAINKAAGLVEALGYIQRFHDKVIVVKVGGSIMDDEPRSRPSSPTSSS
jgi:acetylglutamate kinase